MTKDEELYELIFCTQYGAENRERLIEKYKDKMPEMKKQHKKHGLKINNKAIPFKRCLL